MEENKDINKSSFAGKTFKKEPPADAWNKLDADLERRRTAIYRQKANRFRWLSITLALLLFSFISYYYFNAGNKGLPIPPVNSGILLTTEGGGQGSAGNKSLPDKKSEVNHHSEINHASTGLISSIEKNKTARPQSVNNSAHQKNNLPVKSESQLAVNESTKKDSQPGERKSASAVEKPRPPRYLSGRYGREASLHDGKEKQTGGENINASNNHPAMAATELHSEEINAVQPKTDAGNRDSEKNNLTEVNSTPASIAGNTEKQMKPATEGTTLTDLVRVSPADSAIAASNKKSRFSIAAFYSRNHSRNHLKDNGMNSDENVNDYYEREKSEFSFTGGIRLGYDLTDRWSLLTGVSYSESSSSMTFSTIYVKYGLDNQLHYQYPTSWGVIEMPNSGKKTLHDGDSVNITAKCTQTVKFINIPVAVRYHLIRSLFSLYADAGLSANFMLEESVDVAIGSRETHVVNNIDGLKKVNYGYLFGIGLEYNIYKQYNIFIEPAFRGSITSITENISVNSYPYAFGLNMGLSYHF